MRHERQEGMGARLGLWTLSYEHIRSDPCARASSRGQSLLTCIPSAMTTHAVVPVELQYHVIDLMWDPCSPVMTEALRRCALTCRAWLEPSRRRLFRRFVLRHTRPHKLDELVRLMTACPCVFNAVEQLVIGVIGGPAPSWDPDYWHGRVRTAPGVVALVLAGKFPRLRSLVVKIPLTSAPKDLLMFAAFPMVTRLFLREGWFESFVALQKILSLLPSLQELYLIRPGLQRVCNLVIPLRVLSRLLSLPKLVRLDYVTWVRVLVQVLYIQKRPAQQLRSMHSTMTKYSGISSVRYARLWRLSALPS